MAPLAKKILSFLPVVFITLLVVVLFATNYTPHTYLTGWDNLHPEFNFKLNIIRSIFSVWEQYQGLGLLAGMAHASDLPHQILLLITSLVLPNDLLRYFYHFLMLFVGSLGVYFLMKNLVLENKINAKISSLISAFVYILNFGTIQYFFVPFEPYSTFFGMLPWEIYALFNFLRKKDNKSLLILALVNLLATPQALVQTIFLVYLIVISITLLIYLITSKTRASFNICVKILTVIFLINSFWLAPNMYFVANKIGVTQNAIQNELATEKFFQMNKNRGNIIDFALQKEFYYDFFDYSNNTSQFTYMMGVWREHLSNPAVEIAGILVFAISFFGIFTNKSRYKKYLIGIFAISAVVFLSDTIIFSQINLLLRSLPVLNQVFRNPFTKFIVPYVLVFALGFGLGINEILRRFSSRVICYGAIFVAFSLVLAYTFPVFKGNFIYSAMRIDIPKEYFSLFSYFDSQNQDKRIMNLPQDGIWGWEYYKFGMRGSGFLWYGINQPILDRAFDVWSAENENYYWQLSYALSKRDQELFNSVINKYQIGFVMLDQNIIFPDIKASDKTVLTQKEFLDADQILKRDASFRKITVYKVQNQTQNFVSQASNLPKIINSEKFSSIDNGFADNNNYVSSQDGGKNFPFGSLFTNRLQADTAFKISQDKSSFYLTSNIKKGDYYLNLPSVLDSDSAFPVEIEVKRDGNNLVIKQNAFTPKISVGGKEFSTYFNPLDISLPLAQESFDNSLILDFNNRDFITISNLSSSFKPVGKLHLTNSNLLNYVAVYTKDDETNIDANNFEPGKDCGGANLGKFVTSATNSGKLFLTAKNTSVCAVYRQSFTSSNTLIQIKANYASTSDEFPQFCLYSNVSNSCINQKDNIRTGFAKSGIFSDIFENPNQEPNLFLHAILQATNDEDKNRLKKISYSKISIITYKNLGSATVDLTPIKDYQTSYKISLTNNSQIKVQIPKINDSLSFVDPISKNIYKTTPLTYDNTDVGKIYFSKNTDNSITSTSMNKSANLLFRASGLDTGFSYIVAAETKNNNGFPFIFNMFTNSDFRNYVYTNGVKSKNFENNFFILPPTYPFDKGVDVLLTTPSYNNSLSSNTLSDLAIYEIPYKFISNISLVTTNAQDQTQASELKPVESRKINYSLYEVPKVEDGQEIILSQSYDKGWAAYSFSKTNAFQKLFPFFGDKINQHDIVNGWENGWRIDNSTIKQGHLSLLIVYLPQYLEYIGFSLLIITILLLLIKSIV